MKNKPDLSFWKLWNLSFGFFGVQIAYALQSAQVSRIFSTIGADPHDLSYFWILPPLMGLIVQPIVGLCSDHTWNKLGRRLPYLLLGAAVAIVVMCFLPNAGSLGLTVSSAILFGLVMLMFLDTSINMAMQPFKMLVGDFVNEKQKSLAYSIQSFLCNAGSVVGYVCPIVLAWFISNTAPQGEVPATVTWSFYIGAFVLMLCVIYTFVFVKELPPHEYAQYQGIEDDEPKTEKGGKKKSRFAAPPKVFWTIGIVQFFCWGAFLYMWTYSTDAIATQAFDAPVVQKVTGVSINGQEYSDKYLFNGQTPVITDGRVEMAGIEVDGSFSSPKTVVLSGDTIIKDSQPVYVNGVPRVSAHQGILAHGGDTIMVDGTPVAVSNEVKTVSQFAMITPDSELKLAHIALKNEKGAYELDEVTDLPKVTAPENIEMMYSTVLNTASEEYQQAGNWNGVVLAIQGLCAVLWAMMIPRFRNRRLIYSLSLLIGALGFLSIYFVHNQWLLCVSYGLVGCAWAAILALPFTILTNALSGNNIGTYLGLFNCTICIPQIVAALCGGLILRLFPAQANGAAPTIFMLMTSGVLLLVASAAVWIIKETYGGKKVVEAKADYTEQEL